MAAAGCVVKDAAQHVIAAVEGLAREISRRVGHDPTVELHAKAVLTDYLLGDFRPVKLDELQPHAYVPSAMHMGDCQLCGHIRESPIHGHASE